MIRRLRALEERLHWRLREPPYDKIFGRQGRLRLLVILGLLVFLVMIVADVGKLGDSTWWWDVALQGVVGSVVGAVAAVSILLLTLSHEQRRLAATEILNATRELLRTTMKLIATAARTDPTDTTQHDQIYEMFDNWEVMLSDLIAQAQLAEPQLADILQGHQLALGDRTDVAEHKPEGLSKLRSVERVCRRRLAEPASFARMSEAEVEKEARAALYRGTLDAYPIDEDDLYLGP